MKRFLIFLLVLALLAGAGYLWWQRNAQRVVQSEVQRLGQRYFTNPAALTVKPSDIRLVALRKARIGKIVISGNKLQMKNGIELAYAKLVLTDVDLTLPTYNTFSGVGGGWYEVKVTEAAATSYLHKRGIKLPGGLVKVPLDSLKVRFTKKNGANISCTVEVPLLKNPVTLTAVGKLATSGQGNQVNYELSHLAGGGRTLDVNQFSDALQMINPVIDLSDWPLTTTMRVITADGMATVKGEITGVKAGLIP